MSKEEIVGEVFGVPILQQSRWRIFLMRFNPKRYKKITSGAYFDLHTNNRRQRKGAK